MEIEQVQTYSYRFDYKDVDAWKAHLADQGFVVVGGFISRDDSERIVEEMKSCLQKFSSKLTDDEKSWTLAKNYPFMLHGGMVQYIAHTKFQWELREKVAPVFAEVWDCKPTDLATSFDGLCYMNGNRKYRKQDPLSFVHSDQSPKKDYLWSVQGLVSLCDNRETDGGLVLIPGSHKLHQEFFKKIGKNNESADWYKFSDEEKKDPIFKDFVKVCGKAGDFMMWDSRTLHCNTVPTSQNIRACVYICQIPKSKVPKKTREKRESIWLAKRCSNHYPGDGFKAFPVVPRYGDQAIRGIIPKVSIEDDDLTELQKSLLCIK